jgi:hypothetical protein
MGGDASLEILGGAAFRGGDVKRIHGATLLKLWLNLWLNRLLKARKISK